MSPWCAPNRMKGHVSAKRRTNKEHIVSWRGIGIKNTRVNLPSGDGPSARRSGQQVLISALSAPRRRRARPIRSRRGRPGVSHPYHSRPPKMTDLLLSLMPFVRVPQGGRFLISPVFCISHVARDLDLMSLCTALKAWLSESADCNHIGLEERRHLSTKDAMTWLRLRERLGLTTRKRPQPKLREIPG